MRAKAINEESSQGKPQALLEIRSLGEGGKIQVGGQLFGC